MANAAQSRMSRLSGVSFAVLVFSFVLQASGQPSSPAGFTNSLRMRMVPIQPGSFRMGETKATPKSIFGQAEYLAHGDWDEHPVHEVAITQPFFIADEEVTIAQ